MPKFINKKALSMKVVKTCNMKCILQTAWNTVPRGTKKTVNFKVTPIAPIILMSSTFLL